MWESVNSVFYFQKIINHLRLTSHAAMYSPTIPPPVVQQVISSMRIIMGKDGTNEGRLFNWYNIKPYSYTDTFFLMPLQQTTFEIIVA